MIAPAFRRLPALAAMSAAGLLVTQTPAFGFLDFFKKGEKKAPSASEKQVQEGTASAMLREAKAAEAAGDNSKAVGIYSTIVKQYPFTDSAAEAAFSKAAGVRRTGQLQDAFDAFQSFIDRYRQSARFSDAIRQQYEIAEEARGGKKQKNFMVIPMKLGAKDVIDMYQKVIKNAPFGKLAPLAQFSIAEIQQEKGEKPLAIAAYQGVVDNYPNTPQAAEAQFRIGSISNVAAQKSQDSGNLTSTRDALTTYVATNPTGERAPEAQAMLQQVDTAQAAESLKIAKFYEKQGKTKAAAIYYNEALKFGTSEASTEARTRLSELARIDPAAMTASKNKGGSDFTVPAAVDLRSREDYVGPPSPELAKLSEKPKMRADDGFQPIPLQEPKLPVRQGADTTPAPGSLLPPAGTDSNKPLLLPVPPPPGSGEGAPAVPPPPAPPPPAEKKP
ncbi:MAG: tetratricopeptide repeat protein [Verrucomicrobiaceae bacterium]|nr:tetratricopeptide repeat protein [Verrucomicrobiaceae bacterium]